MSEAIDLSTDDDINEQLVIAAVEQLHAAMRDAKGIGIPLAVALCKRDQVATLDALKAFFEEQASEQRALGKRKL